MPKAKLTDALLRRRSIDQSTGRAIEYWDVSLPGFGVRFNPRGKKSFICMTRVNGRQRRFTLGKYPATTLADARQKARDIFESASAGIDPKERELLEQAGAFADHRRAMQRRQASFGGIAELFLEEHAKELRTYKEIKRKIEVELLPKWAYIPIEDISRADIKSVLQGMIKRGSKTSANRLHSVVSKIFNWALEEEIIDRSPMAGMRKLTIEKSRERVLTETEISKLWPGFEKLGAPYGSLYQFMLTTAQRRSECSGLKWGEVDFESSTWNLPGERTKNGKGHLIPLSSLAVEILKALPCSSSYVFTTLGDRPVNGFSRTNRRLDGLVEIDDWRLHDLRRTAATHMRGLGVDRLTISKILNHSEGSVTGIYDRYAYDAEKRDAMEKWACKLNELTV